MNALINKIALAAALVALPAAAAPKSQPAQLKPLSQKYSDRGAKPGTARTAGGQEIQAMALLDAAGSTHIDLTIPPGTIEKVQVRVYRGDTLLATDNYSKGLGGAQAAFEYANLRRGDRIEVLAHVKNGRGPMSVASVSTEIHLRPDLEPGIQAPATVGYNAPFSVVGRVRETNGDVGARFDCRLFADGVQVGEIRGAWVDAGGEVACHFTPSLASLGSKQLVVRADGVAPGDYDAGNNAVLANVQVVARAFESSRAWYSLTSSRSAKRIQRWWFIDGSHDDTTTWDWPLRQQLYGMSASQGGSIAADGRLTLRHFMDGTELAPIVADVADLGATENPECRSGFFGNGSFVFLCAFPGYWTAEAQRISNNTVIYTPNGYLEPAPEIPQGTTYRAELTWLDSADARRAAREGEIKLSGRWAEWTAPYCWYYGDGWGITSQECVSSYFEGEAYGMSSGE